MADEQPVLLSADFCEEIPTSTEQLCSFRMGQVESSAWLSFHRTVRAEIFERIRFFVSTAKRNPRGALANVGLMIR